MAMASITMTSPEGISPKNPCYHDSTAGLALACREVRLWRLNGKEHLTSAPRGYEAAKMNIDF